MVCAGTSLASGMQPLSSVVLIREADGEGTIAVRNTDNDVSLLYTAIQDLPGEEAFLVIPTPVVARVEAGEEQLVRFVYQGPPMQTQHMKRVTFEGVGAALESDKQASVGVGIRYDLPMLLHPKGLADNDAPWKGLAWTREGSQLVVRNDTAYVVRLQPQVQLEPSQTNVSLPRPYIRAGEVPRLDTQAPATDTEAVIYPASLQGFAMPAYHAAIN